MPQRIIVSSRLDRRIHFYQRPQPPVVARVEKEMMRANLGGNEVTRLANNPDFVSGRNVQHVEPVMVALGEVDGPSCRNDGCCAVANF